MEVVGLDFGIEQRERKIVDNMNFPLAAGKKQHLYESEINHDSPKTEDRSGDVELDSDYDSDIDVYEDRPDKSVFPSTFVRWPVIEYNLSQGRRPKLYPQFENLANLAVAKYNHDNGTRFQVVKVEQLHELLGCYTDYYLTFTACGDSDAALVTIQAIVNVDVITNDDPDVWFCRIKPN